MPDIRALPSSMNGKLIYQLQSVTELSGDDKFAISTSNNLTRAVTLSQIKKFATSDMVSNDDLENALQELRGNIQTVTNNVNELTEKVSTLDNTLNTAITNWNLALEQTKNEFNKNLKDEIDNLNNSLTTKINNTETSLTQKIEALDKKLESWIMYGTAVPTTLPTGRVYLQYF